VINYNLPDELSNYTHRSGRTGRAGRSGTSVAIIHLKERFKIKEIEQRLNKTFKQCRIPTGMEVCKKQLVSLVDIIKNVEVDHERIDPLYAEIAEKFASMEREELIKKFVSMEFNRFLEYYKKAPDLNVSDGEKKQYGKKERPKGKNERQNGKFAKNGDSNQKFTRFFLNVGRRDGIMPQGLIGKINALPGGGRIQVGKIEIMQNSVFLEADSKYTSQILDAFQHVVINGKTVSIEVARGPGGKGTGRPEAVASGHRKGRKVKTA
jgi:ATP-dependent RNA helicase DeaD